MYEVMRIFIDFIIVFRFVLLVRRKKKGVQNDNNINFNK